MGQGYRTYWQAGVPTRFEVTLIQSGNTLSGGEVIGRRISFTKHYFTSSPDFIDHTGTLSEDENFMQGQWNIAQ